MEVLTENQYFGRFKDLYIENNIEKMVNFVWVMRNHFEMMPDDLKQFQKMSERSRKRF